MTRREQYGAHWPYHSETMPRRTTDAALNTNSDEVVMRAHTIVSDQRREVEVRRFARTLAWLVAAGVALGCSDASRPTGVPHTEPATPTPFVASVAPRPGTAQYLVYVSLPPGSLLGDGEATLRVARTGTVAMTQLVDGGFDPVALSAVEGDTIAVAVQAAGASSQVSYAFVVPKPSRPIVVRTSPPKQKRDVPLNASVKVVFSEPVDQGSLTSSSMQLRVGGVAVTGRLEFADSAHTSAVFVPTAQLAAGTEYELVVTQEIRDLDGMPLESSLSVPFTTDTDTVAAPSLFNIAFTTDRHGEREIYVMNPDGTNQVRLTNNTIIDDFPAWSPNRQKIAFLSGTSGQNGMTCEQCAIYTMNADGTGKTFVTALTGAGSWPFYGTKISWSPDGGRIAFEDVVSNRVNVFVVNIDGTNRVNINDNGSSPSWSPDGSKIMFSRETTPDDGLHLYTMNPNGTGVTLVVTGAGDPWDCYAFGSSEWSPTGEKIIYGATCWEDFMAVFVSQADGTNRQMVAGHWDVGNAGGADWAPEGTRFVFADFWVREIFIGNVDGSPRIQLTTLGNNFSPAW